ncbi:hypothetical protein WA026_006338 [Henosepilachna vigintioctopunctata]|uniref:DNA-directed RNA polymerase III subunit RPC3 n=1 Tax=Henosepilachna vigintioctopunctata TaxID=420089 RepID=A0AAW1TI73_9CUCU
MSFQIGKLISLILQERFGIIIEKVGNFLFEYGSNPLLYIMRGTELPLGKVKEALCILIKYGLVTFKPNNNENIANYSLCIDNILLMTRYPKFLNLLKKKFGDESEMIIEELLQNSYLSTSDIIVKVAERLKCDVNDLPNVRDKFVSLVVAKYIQRLPTPNEEERPVPILEIKESVLFSLPKIDMKLLSQVYLKKIPKEELGETVFWIVNFDRFHQDMRDKYLVDAFTKKFDENVGEFVKLLLQQMYIRTDPWAETSNPVPLLEIKDIVRKKVIYPNLVTFFDQYVTVIEQDPSQIIRKSGEASGGSFQIQLKEAYNQIAWEIVEQVILEKFDSKAVRIFRLVKLKKFVEPDQIQQLAMIPSKEAKKLSYQLLEENFLKLQELKRPLANNGPIKSFTLFYIDLESIVRNLLELCYKTLYNAMTRKSHEKFINKRIIDKKQRVDAIAMGIQSQGATEEQLADIEDMITPPEREILGKIDRKMKKLNIEELEVDATIFLLQMYLKYQ